MCNTRAQIKEAEALIAAMNRTEILLKYLFGTPSRKLLVFVKFKILHKGTAVLCRNKLGGHCLHDHIMDQIFSSNLYKLAFKRKRCNLLSL